MKYCLVGVDGNAFAVMGYVVRAMKEVGYCKQEIDDYLTRAKSSDYDNLLCESMAMIDKCNERAGDCEED